MLAARADGPARRHQQDRDHRSTMGDRHRPRPRARTRRRPHPSNHRGSVCWCRLPAHGGRMKRQDKGRLPPFVALLKDTLASPAWKEMSHGARSLYVALKARYSSTLHNNGRIYLSQRSAGREIGSSANQITRWFRELQHFGFIVQTKGGCLGVNGKGMAPRWRLTECGYHNDPPTRDFMRWSGQAFSSSRPTRKKRAEKKSESCSGKPLHPVAENDDTRVAGNRCTLGNKCHRIPLQSAGPKRSGKPLQI